MSIRKRPSKHLGGENIKYPSSIVVTVEFKRTEEEKQLSWERELAKKSQEEIDMMLDNRIEMESAVNFVQHLINKDL